MSVSAAVSHISMALNGLKCADMLLSNYFLLNHLLLVVFILCRLWITQPQVRRIPYTVRTRICGMWMRMSPRRNFRLLWKKALLQSNPGYVISKALIMHCRTVPCIVAHSSHYAVPCYQEESTVSPELDWFCCQVLSFLIAWCLRT